MSYPCLTLFQQRAALFPLYLVFGRTVNVLRPIQQSRRNPAAPWHVQSINPQGLMQFFASVDLAVAGGHARGVGGA
jgi:hypothetical protein